MELSSIFIPIEAKLALDKDIDKKELNEAINKLHTISKYMSNTIDDFKNFFATTKEKADFRLLEQINIVVSILGDTLKKNGILLDIIVKKNPTVFGLKNEYAQVLINIVNNAKEMLVQRKIKDPKITITVLEDKDDVIISVEDNAGGIKIEHIDDVFKPFFTTEKKNGTGIGLFMSKLIIEKNMDGSLIVENTKNGAIFKIITPKK